jgi:Beta-L-arabinofuranosidase, GH127 catalytic domain
VDPPRDEAPEGFVELGGAGLGLVMLDQYVEATGDTETYREQAVGMARFIVANQAEDGEFESYPPRYPGGKPTRDKASPYYPGEAILGLVRLYSWEGDKLWLESAIRGADWLIDVRDAGKDEKTVANDHWLMLALSYLYLYTQDSKYLDHSIAICRAVEYQYLKNENAWDEYPDFRGGYYDPPRSTPAATRGEGLGAVLETCELSGTDCAWIEELLAETVRHEMMCQYNPDMTYWMADPPKAFGGWAGGLLDVDIRNDFVQHNMSSLLGYERLLLRRDGVTLPGGPGWMEKHLAGTEFSGVPAEEMTRLQAESLRRRGEVYWEKQADKAASKQEDQDPPAGKR